MVAVALAPGLEVAVEAAAELKEAVAVAVAVQPVILEQQAQEEMVAQEILEEGEEVVGEEEFSRVAQGVMEAEAEDRLEQPEGSGAMVAVEEELLH